MSECVCERWLLKGYKGHENYGITEPDKRGIKQKGSERNMENWRQTKQELTRLNIVALTSFKRQTPPAALVVSL